MANITTAPKAHEELGSSLLSIDQLAEWTQIPKSTLYKLHATGKGPNAGKLGRQLRFKPSDVNEWFTALSTRGDLQ